jgi:uncharacterized membrane protein required for colicin V production
MNGIDLFIIIVFGYNIIFGLTQGLMRSLFGIGTFVGASILAPLFKGFAISFILSYFQIHPELAKILGLGVSWFLIYTILSIASTSVIKGMEKTALKAVDRFAGFSVGILMSLIIISVPYLIVKSIPVIKDMPQVTSTMKKSVLLPAFYPIARPFEGIFYNFMREQREAIMNKLKSDTSKALEKAVPSVPKKNKINDIKETMKEYDIKPLGKKDYDNKNKKNTPF